MQKFQKQKKNHISCNGQEQTGSDRNRQNYISDIENYCIIKKFINQIGNPEVRNRQEQTGTDRNGQNRQEQSGMDRTDRMRKKQTRIYRNQQEQTGIDRIISDIENYCIIKKFISHVGNLGANIN